ncbi:MAG: flagellar hook capping protein [Lachnospiraceae bacterium]|nr:flagellar hook capping protein [Lachnospiraceae bacterium]
MSTIAQIKDGQILESVSSLNRNSKTSNSSLDKDAFLQLLVAQMKYQDPLEPTSNTEYISQLATFSELEEMQNLTSGMTLQRASGLVGQYVFMKVTDSSGNTSYPEGTVDYVVYENNKAYLSIGDNLYSIDDLDTVADSKYVQAGKVAEAFVTEMNKLPIPAKVTIDNLEKIGDLITVYENMTEYQKNFLGDENTALYKEYMNKFQELAVTPISNFINEVNKLPKAEEITSEHIGAIHALKSTYDGFSAYQKKLIYEEDLATYNNLIARYEELMAEAEDETVEESVE